MNALKRLYYRSVLLWLGVRRAYYGSPLHTAACYVQALWSTSTWVAWIVARALWHLLSKDIREASVYIEQDTRDAYNSSLKERIDQLHVYIENAQKLLMALKNASPEVRQAMDVQSRIELCNTHIIDCQSEIRDLQAKVK